MSEAQSPAPSRAEAYAEVVAQAAQAVAQMADQNAAANGKDWYKSKGVLGSSIAALGVTLTPSILAAAHASPQTSQTVTSAIVVGASLLALVGRMSAKRPVK